MMIFISVQDLEEEFRETPSNIDRLKNCGIDYMTSTLDGIIDEKEYIIFDFKKYGIKLDNRWTDYRITKGEAGIFIEITSTK